LFTLPLVALGCILTAEGTLSATEAEKASPDHAKIRVVILVGGHPFDQDAFDRFWKGYDGFTCEVWKGSPYSIFDDISRFDYDAMVFYNMCDGITDAQKKNFQTLLDRGVGVVVWHHALADCQDWPQFEKIAGARFWTAPGERDGVKVPQSGVGFGKIRLHIEDPKHPITAGMADFEIEDEAYNHQTFWDGIHVLVTADHPSSDRPIAWVHRCSKARVFGCQSGHDAKVWTNESFQRLMAQSIRWVAGRLPDADQP
jgi:type 1 glutamine amidotransferase